MLAQSLCAFLGAAGFAILLMAPWRTVGLSGLAGTLGWSVYRFGDAWTGQAIVAAALAGLAVGVVGETIAHWHSAPALTFTMPAIVLIAPGFGLYLVLLDVVQGRPLEAGGLAVETLLSSAAIAGSLALAASLYRVADRSAAVFEQRQEFEPGGFSRAERASVRRGHHSAGRHA